MPTKKNRKNIIKKNSLTCQQKIYKNMTGKSFKSPN